MNGATSCHSERVPPHRSPTFRSDIEGLRGIAVLVVVLFHCGVQGFSGGFIGVDVFFVLSGFLITGMLVTELQQSSELNLLQFYARRARRLLPVFALTVIVTLLVGTFLLAPRELDLAGRAGRAAALYVSNMFFDTNAADYFGPDIRSNPLLHTWSLAVEEQFYLFWPLLIWVSFRWWRSMTVLVTVLVSLTLVSFGIGVWLTEHSSTVAFYELPARAWEFGIGGLAVLLPRGMLTMRPSWWLTLSWLGLFSILSAVYAIVIMGDTGFPGWIALIPTLGTVAVLIAGTEQPNRGAGAVLGAMPLQRLGRLSYSWYLWHWPFLVFSTALLPTISVAGKLVAAAASLAVAGISYYFVENPVRFHPRLLKRPALSVGLAGIVTACSFTAALISMGLAAEFAKEPQMEPITTALGPVSTLPRTQCTPAQESAELKLCHFGNGSSGVHIVLFGDSHAVHLFNPLQRMAEENGWRLTTLVKPSCNVFDFQLIGHGAAQKAACTRWRAEALEQIDALHPTLVFIGTATSYFGEKDVNYPWVTYSLADLQTGTRQVLLALRGLRVVIMRDGPDFPYDVPTCLARSARHPWYPSGSCEADRSVVMNPSVFKAQQAGARELSNVSFIDLSDRFCRKDTCGSMESGTVMYRDHHHFTASFAESLRPALEKELLPLVHPPS